MGAGLDYGRGLQNIDTETGIRFGVISQNEVLQAWADSSEPYYGKPEEPIKCPDCGAEIIPTDDTEWGDDRECTHELGEDRGTCGATVTFELDEFAEPLCFTLDEDGYQAQSGDDGDIFIVKSPFYTKCRFCSPCAPGAGYLMSPDPDGIKAYCFGHDWFDGSRTCQKCCGTGNIGFETYIECDHCHGSGQIELGAPYPVYDVKTDLLVTP
jgi:hypothetical protein